jgi:hypothetical protein
VRLSFSGGGINRSAGFRVKHNARADDAYRVDRLIHARMSAAA